MYYVDTRVEPQKAVIDMIVDKTGMGYAQSMVSDWFQKYEGFMIDTELVEIVLFKKRVLGYWEVNDKIINNYSKK